MKDKYLTVTALTKYLKRKMELDPHLRNVWMRGEISNFKLHSRGHMYLTLKDDHARIQAVMFAGSNRNLTFMPENGMNVLVRGEVNVFESYGQYQLYIKEMEPDGIGALYLAFEQLKEKLEKKGYFSPEHKKTLPAMPRHIGVITSPTGAAVRDIITTIRRRYPIVQATVLPVLVQGPEAAKSIRDAIEKANRLGIFDVLIVGRGGGSIEELWSFNEESVAEAIFQSSIPIISAVGHETDTTISDFVADLRAPTPTGAAEMAVPSRVELLERNRVYQQRLQQALSSLIERETKHLARLRSSYAFRYPEQLIAQKEQQLDAAEDRMNRAIAQLIEQKRERAQGLRARMLLQHPEKQIQLELAAVGNLKKQLNQTMRRILEQHSAKVLNEMDKLSLLNPLEVMKRGFSIPYSEDGNIIRTVRELKTGDMVTVKLHDGQAECEIRSTEVDEHGRSGNDHI